MEESEREEEEEEESPKELEPEEEEIAIAGAGGLGFLRYWLWEEEGVCCGEEPIRVRLNSERWESDRQFHVLRGASCRDVASSLVVTVCLMSINGKMKRRIGFGTIIAKTRGACVIAIN